jgi:hypothetical protein
VAKLIVTVDSSKGVAHIGRAIAKLTKAVRDTVVGTGHEGIEYAARRSPQYSGAFAGNWRLALNQMNTGRGTSSRDDTPLAEGTESSIRGALASKSAIEGWTPKDVVYLATSSMDADTGKSYSWDIEANVMKFRSVNPSKGAVRARSLGVMAGYLATRLVTLKSLKL